MTALLIAFEASAATLTGRVIHVEDGDTVVFRTVAGENVEVRIEDIDAPETCHFKRDPTCTNRPGQPFGRRAGEELKVLVLGKSAIAECQDAKDIFGRYLCTVYVDNTSVGMRMVERGYVWLYRVKRGDRYVIKTSNPQLIGLEAAARSGRIGLWVDPAPVYPGEWRRLCWNEGQCTGKVNE